MPIMFAELFCLLSFYIFSCSTICLIASPGVCSWPFLLGPELKYSSKTTQLLFWVTNDFRPKCFAIKPISFGDGRSYASLAGLYFSYSSIASNNCLPQPPRCTLLSTQKSRTHTGFISTRLPDRVLVKSFLTPTLMKPMHLFPSAFIKIVWSLAHNLASVVIT